MSLHPISVLLCTVNFEFALCELSEVTLMYLTGRPRVAEQFLLLASIVQKLAGSVNSYADEVRKKSDSLILGAWKSRSSVKAAGIFCSH